MSQYNNIINTSTKSILECVTCGKRKVDIVVFRNWCEYIGREEQNETGREGGREGSEGIQEKGIISSTRTVHVHVYIQCTYCGHCAVPFVLA